MKTGSILRSLLVVAGFFASTGLFAQTASDTVCEGATSVPYWVTPTAGSTYYWTVTGGTVASGQNTDAITVDFDATEGFTTIKVVEENEFGCYGDSVEIVVWRMPLPTATVTGGDTVCFEFGSSFDVAFTGVGPWSFTYTDGTDSWTVNDIATSTYTVNTPNLSTTTTYSVTDVWNEFGCTGSSSGDATIVVRPKPVTSLIMHN